MPSTCCLPGCTPTHVTRRDKNDNILNVSLFSFPNEKECSDERERWVNSIKCVYKGFEVKKHSKVCEKHWPTGYATFRKKGHVVPQDPPSVFTNVT